VLTIKEKRIRVHVTKPASATASAAASFEQSRANSAALVYHHGVSEGGSDAD